MTLKTAIHSHSLLCTKHRKCVDRDSLALSTQHLHELVAFMRLIAERLKSEARNGRTILVITHDRELIESCCDNVVEVEKRSL